MLQCTISEKVSLLPATEAAGQTKQLGIYDEIVAT